jgi:hypothetical protein
MANAAANRVFAHAGSQTVNGTSAYTLGSECVSYAESVLHAAGVNVPLTERSVELLARAKNEALPLAEQAAYHLAEAENYGAMLPISPYIQMAVEKGNQANVIAGRYLQERGIEILGYVAERTTGAGAFSQAVATQDEAVRLMAEARAAQEGMAGLLRQLARTSGGLYALESAPQVVTLLAGKEDDAKPPSDPVTK